MYKGLLQTNKPHTHTQTHTHTHTHTHSKTNKQRYKQTDIQSYIDTNIQTFKNKWKLFIIIHFDQKAKLCIIQKINNRVKEKPPRLKESNK